MLYVEVNGADTSSSPRSTLALTTPLTSTLSSPLSIASTRALATLEYSTEIVRSWYTDDPAATLVGGVLPVAKRRLQLH